MPKEEINGEIIENIEDTEFTEVKPVLCEYLTPGLDVAAFSVCDTENMQKKSTAQTCRGWKKYRIQQHGLDNERPQARPYSKGYVPTSQLTPEQREIRNKKARERVQAKKEKQREELGLMSTEICPVASPKSGAQKSKESRERRIELYGVELERERARQASRASYWKKTPEEREKLRQRKREEKQARRQKQKEERAIMKARKETERENVAWLNVVKTLKSPQWIKSQEENPGKLKSKLKSTIKSISTVKSRWQKDREKRIRHFGLEYERARSRQATNKSYIPISQLPPEEQEQRRKRNREVMKARREGRPIPKLKKLKPAKDSIDYEVLNIYNLA